MNTSTVVRTLVDVVSKGGNLLLDVGPDGRGQLPPGAVNSVRLALLLCWYPNLLQLGGD